MLTYEIRDVQDRAVRLRCPLKVSLSSSEDAPADQLRVMFALEGRIPALRSVELRQDDERVFFGLIDSQWEDSDSEGVLLTITARSAAALLLDNEAMPQTYCSPSMPLLMKRHFAPLGFTDFIGPSRAFSGELAVTKGMSEWTVLKDFCRYFPGTAPRIRRDGVIDISGEEKKDVLQLEMSKLLFFRRIRSPQKLISDVMVRTYSGGGYEMPLRSEKAHALGIRRKRCVDAFGSSSRTVLTAKELLREHNAGYEQVIAECAGGCFCEIGTELILRGDDRRYRIREVNYTLDASGERTRIYAEVKEDETI